MFGSKHYVPILKGKQAEINALGQVKNPQRITPLIEAVPSAKEKKTVAARLSDEWKQPFFVDFNFYEDETPEESEASIALFRCLEDAREFGLHAIPVTGLTRSQDYQKAVVDSAGKDGHGLAIRLWPDDFIDPDYLADGLEALVEFSQLDRQQVDLIIDQGSVFEMQLFHLSSIQRRSLELIPNVSDWRTLTVCAGAFPMGLASLKNESWTSLPRVDWDAWYLMARQRQSLKRMPTFGDYAVSHPNLLPPGQYTIVAQLRYTLDDEFFVWKGRRVIGDPKGVGYEQFHEICKDLSDRVEFSGAEFSHGDELILEKSTTQGSPGNATSWRMIGTSHHLEMVVRQISSLHDA